MLITVIRPVNIGGYRRLALGHTVLGKWTVHHAAEKGKTIEIRERHLDTCCVNTFLSAQLW